MTAATYKYLFYLAVLLCISVPGQGQSFEKIQNKISAIHDMYLQTDSISAQAADIQEKLSPLADAFSQCLNLSDSIDESNQGQYLRLSDAIRSFNTESNKQLKKLQGVLKLLQADILKYKQKKQEPTPAAPAAQIKAGDTHTNGIALPRGRDSVYADSLLRVLGAKERIFGAMTDSLRNYGQRQARQDDIEDKYFHGLLLLSGAVLFMILLYNRQYIKYRKLVILPKKQVTSMQNETAATVAKEEIANPEPLPTNIAEKRAGTWPPGKKAGRYFFGEIMMTAGPRKDFAAGSLESDRDLGEDVAGFVTRKEAAFFWMLDGTSDSDKFYQPVFIEDEFEEEVFSSRLLAQSIGWNIQRLIDESKENLPGAAALLRQALLLTEKEWQERINLLNEQSVQKLNFLLDSKNGVLQCSTTVIFGVLQLNGHLDICRVGDSNVVTYPGSDFPKTDGRQFAILKREAGKPSVFFNGFKTLKSQHQRINNIETLIVMTDGISGNMGNWLKSRRTADFSDIKTRQIITHFRQGTGDDKALCILQIKG